MAVIISNISLPVGASDIEIILSGLKKAGISQGSAVRTGIHKISLDARKQNDIRVVSSVWAELQSPEEERRLCLKRDNCALVDVSEFIPRAKGSIRPEGRIAVAGFGPAGMFAALVLAECGYRPVVFERGADVDSRAEAVSEFWSGGKFSEESNVQFGEGGAGTFSDGKLTTRIKDPLCRFVSARLVQMGAPEEILVKAKPHIGTDRLREVVRNIRKEVIRLGGEVRFCSRVEDISVQNGRLKSVTVNGEEIGVSALILAVGHSARDTFEMLAEKGIDMTPKPFAVGARIEHTQQAVDRSLYGVHAGDPVLPQGEYQMSYTKNGRGVYTFCMCPGGTVVPSQSEENTVVTNGMSEFARDGRNANAALVVSVSPDDFGQGVLDGVEFARRIERAAFTAAGSSYCAPACSVGAFLEGRADISGLTVDGTYARGVVPCDFNGFLPSFVTDAMRTGLSVFAKRMNCFGDKGALLTAPETRTSSPVRIIRGENMCSPSAAGLYPCGEGAGYAGGIMSAAVDGVKQACAVMELYSNIF
ncbi:MAG: NAD(P)/FAD-dependent oxidoreductase [Oscillospiraceae bacterium]|nr:NAD(P)/FAD-dependent oxidoreductase [Oscillospiraceae bacterium]